MYLKYSLVFEVRNETLAEQFFAGLKVLKEPGYLPVMEYSFFKKKEEQPLSEGAGGNAGSMESETGGRDAGQEGTGADAGLLEAVSKLKKGMVLDVERFWIKEGETSPPKRYNSGSMILAMENAGQLIEDEELRATIKGSGIGTSATRAEILSKLVKNRYLALHKKTQVITPALLGEMIFDVVSASLKQLLNPELTASWEKGLAYVAEGSITPQEYMEKLEYFIKSRTSGVLGLNNQNAMRSYFEKAGAYYK